MQKQKTIAKWLAVILLVTVAIACYIVLDAIFLKDDSNNQNVADAKQDNNASDTNTNLPNDIAPTEPILPVYSTLPRNCENINNMQVAHIGGENQEKLLDTIYCFGKTLVIFSTLSEQYDVKQSGIYIGVFDDMTLTKIVRVCDVTSLYLGGVQTSGGLMIATSDESATTLSLYDQGFGIRCQSTLQRLESITFSTNSQDVSAFIYDGKFLKCATLNSSLEANVSNYIFECEDLSIESIIPYGTSTYLFCNHAGGATVLSYTQNKGFSKHNYYDKHSIEQVLPILQSGEQAFVLLTKSDENYDVISLDSTLKQNGVYTIKRAQNALLYQASNGIEIVTDNSIVKLCSHLDFISSTPIEIEDENGNKNAEFSSNSTAFLSVENLNNLLVIHTLDKVILYKKADNVFTQILSINTIEKPIFTTGKNSQNQEYIKLFFNSDLQNSFAYMCFGNFDVFAISILTSQFA